MGVAAILVMWPEQYVYILAKTYQFLKEKDIWNICKCYVSVMLKQILWSYNRVNIGSFYESWGISNMAMY